MQICHVILSIVVVLSKLESLSKDDVDDGENVIWIANFAFFQ